MAGGKNKVPARTSARASRSASSTADAQTPESEDALALPTSAESARGTEANEGAEEARPPHSVATLEAATLKRKRNEDAQEEEQLREELRRVRHTKKMAELRAELDNEQHEANEPAHKWKKQKKKEGSCQVRRL